MKTAERGRDSLREPTPSSQTPPTGPGFRPQIADMHPLHVCAAARILDHPVSTRRRPGPDRPGPERPRGLPPARHPTRNDPRLAPPALPAQEPRDPTRVVPSLLASGQADALHAGGLLGAAGDVPRRRVHLGRRADASPTDCARSAVSKNHRGYASAPRQVLPVQLRERSSEHQGELGQRLDLLESPAVLVSAAWPECEA